LFTRVIESVNTWVGKGASRLYPLLVVIVVVNVALRYVFGLGLIEFEEIQWHLYAAAFLLAFAWTYVDDAHVRVDLFRDRYSARTKAWIELLGCALLLCPFAAIVAYYSFDFFWSSWLLNERSDMPSGLPARYVIKFILSASLVMLWLQSAAVATKNLLFLIGYRTR
jgi:TRAP-type mannitol/chloroaromatic compound transport system permease small subunit